MSDRRPNYDVTNSIMIDASVPVCEAVRHIFKQCYKSDFSLIERAFETFEHLFNGDHAGYHGCDTYYHDKQHTLDVTLALARLMDGYERQCKTTDSLGAKRATIALITALFHDVGYIRKQAEDVVSGAVFTKIHVSRSASFLEHYLISNGLSADAPVAANLVHYTGYEVAIKHIQLPDPHYHLLGRMLGTADLIAQMSDRCYLEKCRDRLFLEFLQGGLTRVVQQDGTELTLYGSGNELLLKTPDFFKTEILIRLVNIFDCVYDFAAKHFDGQNFYMEILVKNQAFLNRVITERKLDHLRRVPLGNRGTQQSVYQLMQKDKN